MSQEPSPKSKHRKSLVTIIFIPVHFVLNTTLHYLHKWSTAKMGKAMKPEYLRLIEDLDPKKAYSPESISESLVAKQQGRCLKVLKRFKMYHRFPPGGDTTIVTPNGTIPVWYGERWQEALRLQTKDI